MQGCFGQLVPDLILGACTGMVCVPLLHVAVWLQTRPPALRRDGELRMWNMAKGKCSYHTKLAAAADGVAFAPPADDASAGSVYALLIGTTVSVHSAEGDGTTLHTLRHEQRALCMAFNGEHTMLTGAVCCLCWLLPEIDGKGSLGSEVGLSQYCC